MSPRSTGKAWRQIADILVKLPRRVEPERVCEKAVRLAQYERALADARRDYPRFLKEVEKGDVEGVAPTQTFTFEEYLAWSAEQGEWPYPVPTRKVGAL